MSERIKENWIVLVSIEDANHDFCLDIFQREDDSYGFEAFRQDPEDMGRWQPLSHYSILTFESLELVWQEAYKRLAWLQLEYATADAFGAEIIQQLNQHQSDNE